MNKRGMFFTLLTIVIISLFVLSFVFIPSYEERKTTQRRVETLNSFVLAVEDDMERQLYTSGYRIIFVFEKKILENDAKIDEFDARVTELFMDGKYLGVDETVMIDAKFNGIQDSLNEIASKVNAEVVMTNPVFTLTQEDPWNVNASLTVDLVIKDTSGLASWTKTAETYSAYIPISNFDDPLYILSTHGLLTKKMIQGTILPDGTSSQQALNDHILNSQYIANPDAPSFLDRLQGIDTSNGNGVESFVNLDDLSDAQINAKSEVSVVDHIYFPDGAGIPVYGCTGMPSWFILDGDHVTFYNSYGFVCS